MGFVILETWDGPRSVACDKMWGRSFARQLGPPESCEDREVFRRRVRAARMADKRGFF